MAFLDWFEAWREELPLGLVECELCQQLAAPRSNHLSVHFPRGSTRPCPKSWPPPPPPKKKS